MKALSRRHALGLMAGVTLPPVAAVAAAPVIAPESPSDRVERLAYELSDALAEYQDGKFRAIIYPPSTVGRDPVHLVKIDAEHRHATLDELEDYFAFLWCELAAASKQLNCPMYDNVTPHLQRGIERYGRTVGTVPPSARANLVLRFAHT